MRKELTMYYSVESLQRTLDDIRRQFGVFDLRGVVWSLRMLRSPLELVAPLRPQCRQSICAQLHGCCFFSCRPDTMCCWSSAPGDAVYNVDMLGVGGIEYRAMLSSERCSSRNGCTNNGPNCTQPVPATQPTRKQIALWLEQIETLVLFATKVIITKQLARQISCW